MDRQVQLTIPQKASIKVFIYSIILLLSKFNVKLRQESFLLCNICYIAAGYPLLYLQKFGIIMDWIMEPWPWYISGPMIAFVMFLLLMMGRKLGMSSNLRTLCAICGAGKRATFFDYDWKAQKWNLIVVAGVVLGGFLAANFLMNEKKVDIHDDVVKDLNAYGFASADNVYLPKELYAAENLSDPKVLALLIIGGLFIGFGTRYAGGCTSGHAISGLSSLQWPSLVAVIGFFAGGLFMVHIIFPLIF